MDKIRLLIVSASILFALTGCKSKPSMVGEWTGSQPNPMGGAAMETTAKFNADGSFSFSSGSGPTAAELDGTYTYDDAGKQLTLNMKSMKMGGQDVGKGMTPPPGQPTPVTWKSDSEITFKAGMEDMDLKKKS